MNYVYNFFGGKSTFFAFWFFGVGCVLAFMGKLTADYIGLAAALQTLIALRSMGDDYHQRESKRIDQNGNGNH